MQKNKLVSPITGPKQLVIQMSLLRYLDIHKRKFRMSISRRRNWLLGLKAKNLSKLFVSFPIKTASALLPLFPKREVILSPTRSLQRTAAPTPVGGYSINHVTGEPVRYVILFKALERLVMCSL